MGNAIQKRFNLPNQHTATAGHVNNWKIWPGKGKDGGQLVSIWAFDKTDLTKRKLNPVADKTIVEQVFQIMKRDFGVIKDSKACSNIIQILEVVEDSKNGIAFTTERIVCSLADILNNFENVPGGPAEHTSFFESGPAISEMEISRGLLNITLAIQYLHTVQRKLHLNITPEDIVITASGQWKLCGFGFALNFIQGDTQRLASPYFMQASPITTTSLVSRLEPDLRYAAPECTDGGFNPPGVRYLTPVADMFALGLVFYEIYRFNLKYTAAERSYHKAIVPVTNNDASQHHIALSTLQGVDFSFLPPGLVAIVSHLMQMNVQFRSTCADVVGNAYFVTGAQAVLNMIESMHTRDLGTQSSQLLSLQPELANFPPRMLIHSVIPAVSKLCLATPNLWVYALPLHAELCVLLPEDKYVYFAGPYLAQGLSATDAPNETLQVFLSGIQFISRHFGAEFFQANVTTLLCTALEKPNLYLQNLALEKLAEEYVYTMFNTTTLVEKLMPVLCKIACKNAEPTIKIQSLYIISLLTHKLDESYIAANILTSLKYITDHEKNPLVSMSVVGNFESISNSLGLNYVATSVLPILQNMLLDTGLDKNQFEIVVNMIKRLLKKIIDKRTAELKMPTISVAEVPGSDMVDPFTTAKQLITQSKDKNIASNYGMITGSYRLFSGERAITSTNAATNSAYNVTAPTKYTTPVNASAAGTANTSMYESSGANSGSMSGGNSGGYGSMYTSSPANPATYDSTSSMQQSAAPPAPNRAPPPPPSAPPPSHAPPPVPAPMAVGGFGAHAIASANPPYGSAASILPPLQSYGSTYNATITTSASTATTATAAAAQPSISAYQSSFSTPATAMNSPSTAGYGTPLSPLDSGLPGFGSTGILTPASSTNHNNNNMNNAGTSNASPYNNSVTGIGSGPLGEETEKKSRFSFFGSKKSEPKTSGTKESLMDSSGAVLYVPPVVPNASYGSSGSASNSGGGMYGSSGGMGMSNSSNNSNSAAPDLDDFLSSFGSSAPANTMNSTSTATAGGYNHNNNTLSGTAAAAPYTTPAPAYRSSFGASTGSYNPAPVPASGGSTLPSNAGASTKSLSSLGSTTSGLSIEQQIAQAQQEIARLSTNSNNNSAPNPNTASPYGNASQQYAAPSTSSAWPSQPATQHFGYGAPVNNNNAAPAAQASYNPPNMGYQPQAAPQQQQQQGYYNQQPPQQAQGYGINNGYNSNNNIPPSYSQGTIPGYSYNPNTNNLSNMNNMNNANRNAPTGYQPPQTYANNSGTAKPATDVFDFLN